MALPQKVLDQLSREPAKTPGWAGQFLMFSATLFFISISTYFGIVFGYMPYLTSEVKKLQDEINAFSQQVPLEEQEKIIDFYSQISNLHSVLKNHIFSSDLFEWVEKNVQVNVYYEKFSFNVKNGEVRLGVAAKTIEDLTQQMAVFSDKTEISSLKTTGIIFSGNMWHSDISLTFDQSFFRHQGGL